MTVALAFVAVLAALINYFPAPSRETTEAELSVSLQGRTHR
jgi:hypothetical protein